MKIKFLTLKLQCRKSEEVINFSPQISYFHGEISAGKSSILRLMDFCLGGNVERTPAISQELVSVQLTAKIGNYKVVFERQASGSNQIHVIWQDEEGKSASVLAPKDAGAEPIWENDVFNLSDLIFHLSGFSPIKVRKSKIDESSPLVRLSFRDIIWYCYLAQDEIDSSFYHLRDPYRQLKSRDAIRYITGFYTEKMNELEGQLYETINERLTNSASSKQIRAFLKDFGYGDETELIEKFKKIDDELTQAEMKQKVSHDQYSSDTHFADELRNELRILSKKLAVEEQAISDLDERIEEQESLKAELMSANFKLARAETSSVVLSGVSFDYCPACGSILKDKNEFVQDSCELCGRHLSDKPDEFMPQAEIISRDLNSRIDDLNESLNRHKNAREKQMSSLINLKDKKATFDNKLNKELIEYDSAYLAQSREIEHQVATFKERKRGLEKISKMIEGIKSIDEQSGLLKVKEDELKRSIVAEKDKLINAHECIEQIEETYLNSMLRVGVPGVNKKDKVEINRKTWIPLIIPAEGDPYSFFNAGSAGKKTLLNVCYALSIHKVSADKESPLPTFLMIDTPMKNIGEDVNIKIFQSFYAYLYELASDELSNTQIIMVDKEYINPSVNLGLHVFERFMSPDDPLISYYSGP